MTDSTLPAVTAAREALIERFDALRNSGVCSPTTRGLLDDAQALIDLLTAPPSEEEIEALRRIIARGSYSRFPDDLPYADVADRIVAASGRRHLPTEPGQWEWGLISPDAVPGQYGSADRAHLVSRNREHIERQHRRGHPSIMLAHRRPAGPWEVCDEQ